MIYFFVLLCILIFLLIDYYFNFNSDETQDDLNIKRVPGFRINRSYKIFSKTNDKQNSLKSESLGWVLKRNSHIEVKINIPYFKEDDTVEYYLNDLGCRSNVSDVKKSNIKEFTGFFGCSITYGHGLNEVETYPYLLSKKIKDLNYLNFAVPGYSTYQSLETFKCKLKEVKFNKIVLGIHRDLERRNTCSISWSKIINNFWGIPSMIDLKFLNLKFKPRFIYKNKFGLFITKIFCEVLNFLRFFLGSIRFIQKNTQKKLLLDFKDVCEQNDIELIIICLDNYNEIFDFLTDHKFNWTTSNISLTEKNINGEYIWQKMPWDNHPNLNANKIFASQLEDVFRVHVRPYKPNIKKIDASKNDQEYIYPLW